MRKQRAYLQVFCLLLIVAEPAFSLLGVPPFSVPAQPRLVGKKIFYPHTCLTIPPFLFKIDLPTLIVIPAILRSPKQT